MKQLSWRRQWAWKNTSVEGWHCNTPVATSKSMKRTGMFYTIEYNRIYSTLRIKCKYERISVINRWLIVCVPGACWNYVGFNLFNHHFPSPANHGFSGFSKRKAFYPCWKDTKTLNAMEVAYIYITSIKSYTYWLKLVLQLPPPPPLSFQTWPGLKGGFTHLIWEICQTTSNSLSKSCIPVTICWAERHHILIILQATETQND